MIQDSMFTCNVRFAYDATIQSQSSPLPIWLLAYDLFANYPLGDLALHGTDLLPAFWNSHTDPQTVAQMLCSQFIAIPGCRTVMTRVYLPAVEAIRKQYQGYLAAFAVTGDPNASGGSATPWAHPVPGDALGNVLTVTKGSFASGTDGVTTEDACGFWACVAAAVTAEEVPSRCNCGVSDSSGFVVVQGGGDLEGEDL